MTPVALVHVGGGLIAIAAGALAAAAPKGRALHARAGTAFFAMMLLLAVTASILHVMEGQDPLNGVFVGYFAVTSWLAARRRDGVTGRTEIIACAVALTLGALTVWSGFTGSSTTPAGPAPVFLLGGLILLAGLCDLRVVLARTMTPAQRISRHLWRMCFAFFVGTGSFFLGQQQFLPPAMRGSPILFVLAFAPLGLMAVWLVLVRFGYLRFPLPAGRQATAPALENIGD